MVLPSSPTFGCTLSPLLIAANHPTLDLPPLTIEMSSTCKRTIDDLAPSPPPPSPPYAFKSPENASAVFREPSSITLKPPEISAMCVDMFGGAPATNLHVPIYDVAKSSGNDPTALLQAQARAILREYKRANETRPSVLRRSTRQAKRRSALHPYAGSMPPPPPPPLQPSKPSVSTAIPPSTSSGVVFCVNMDGHTDTSGERLPSPKGALPVFVHRGEAKGVVHGLMNGFRSIRDTDYNLDITLHSRGVVFWRPVSIYPYELSPEMANKYKSFTVYWFGDQVDTNDLLGMRYESYFLDYASRTIRFKFYDGRSVYFGFTGNTSHPFYEMTLAQCLSLDAQTLFTSVSKPRHPIDTSFEGEQGHQGHGRSGATDSLYDPAEDREGDKETLPPSST